MPSVTKYSKWSGKTQKILDYIEDFLQVIFFEVMKLTDCGDFLGPACKCATFVYNVATTTTYDAGRQAYTEIQERSPFS